MLSLNVVPHRAHSNYARFEEAPAAARDASVSLPHVKEPAGPRPSVQPLEIVTPAKQHVGSRAKLVASAASLGAVLSCIVAGSLLGVGLHTDRRAINIGFICSTSAAGVCVAVAVGTGAYACLRRQTTATGSAV